MLFSRLLLCVVWLYAPCCIVVSGDKGVIADMSKDESVVLVANHQIYLDWVYLWSLACGKDAYMKIVLKDAFKRIPLFGYAMQIFGFVFLKRDAAYDRDVMMDAFSEAKRSELPVCLLLFPEGTVISNHTKSVSREYARKNGLNLLDNVLLPRTVGVDLALNGLKGRVEHVYDVTVGYKGLKRPCLKNGYPEDVLSMMNVFGRSLGPRKVYMHIRKYSVEDVASGGDVDKWIHQVYEEKDALMERFYETGKFGDAVDSFVVGPSLFDIATLCLCVVLAGGVAIGMIYYYYYYSTRTCRNPSGYTIAS